MRPSTTKADKYAIGLSAICVVHCLVTPIAVIMLPALGATFLEDERFHYGILFLVIPTSLYALSLGCRKHGRNEILGIGLIGLLVLSSVLFISEETLGEIGEKVVTVIGAVIVALAHVRNYSLCQTEACTVDSESTCN